MSRDIDDLRHPEWTRPIGGEPSATWMRYIESLEAATPTEYDLFTAALADRERLARELEAVSMLCAKYGREAEGENSRGHFTTTEQVHEWLHTFGKEAR